MVMIVIIVIWGLGTIKSAAELRSAGQPRAAVPTWVAILRSPIPLW